ncbi:hypothetical protein ACA097_09510 [Pseudomonas sp. QL9]|uniref:hypothetical protein n=1 Tax=Pseudomonas sp. QL9 TaxID=3242725 RepID=UPI003529FCBF
MTVRVYTSLDTGAPALTGDHFDKIRTILMACLVTGYGGKPGAGWTVGHDIPAGFSLGNGDGFVNYVRNSSAEFVGIYIMESVTDGTTGLAGGVNRRSAYWYDGSSETTRGFHYLQNSLINHWMVVADEKTCIYQAGYVTSTTSANAISAITYSAQYFGRYINAMGLSGPAEFCSVGNGYNTSGNGWFTQAYGCCLRNPFTGVVDQGAAPRYFAPGANFGDSRIAGFYQNLRAKVYPARLQPVRAALACFGSGLNGATTSSQAAIAGYLRGLITEPCLSISPLSEVLVTLGLTNTWQGRVRPINIPGGRQWLPIFGYTQDLGFFASLDAADWG